MDGVDLLHTENKLIIQVDSLRHLMNKGKKVTWTILLLGFTTFSLAHLFYVFFHLFIKKAPVKINGRLILNY